MSQEPLQRNPSHQERLSHAVWDWRAAPAVAGPDAAGKGRLPRPPLGAVLRRSLWAVGAAAVLLILGRRTLAGIAAAVGVGSFLLGIVWPGAWVGIDRLADRFAGAVGRGLAVALLAPVFFLVIVPGGLWLRLRRRDPLHRRFREPGLSYWIRRRIQPEPQQYARQFLVEDRAARAERRPMEGPGQGGGA